MPVVIQLQEGPGIEEPVHLPLDARHRDPVEFILPLQECPYLPRTTFSWVRGRGEKKKQQLQGGIQGQCRNVEHLPCVPLCGILLQYNLEMKVSHRIH